MLSIWIIQNGHNVFQLYDPNFVIYMFSLNDSSITLYLEDFIKIRET